MHLEITSPANNNIKYVKSLHKRKYRNTYGEFLIEGLRIVEYAVDNNAEFNTVYYNDEITKTKRGCDLLQKISDKDIDLYKVNDTVLKQIANTDNSQGILGVVKKQYNTLDQIINNDKLFLIILDRLQDPGNVGTIIRTADAAGADAIVTIKGTVDVYNSKTIRSTMGSIFTIPIIQIDDVEDLVKILKQNDSDIIATTLEADKYHFEVEYGKKNAVIIGNEANGISDELIKHSNIKVKIPIIGSAESLNASIASGIIMYELVKWNYFQKI